MRETSRESHLSPHSWVYTLCMAALILLIPAVSVAQNSPTGSQRHIVTGRETQVHDFFEAVRSGEGVYTQLPDDMDSVVTLTASTDEQTIIYDHWEDGYEADITCPVQQSTEVCDDGSGNFNCSALGVSQAQRFDRLTRAEPLAWESDDPTATSSLYRPVPTEPRSPGNRCSDPDSCVYPNDFRYDGGDAVWAFGGPVNLVHNIWPDDETRIGGAWEIYSWATVEGMLEFHIPLGADAYQADSDDYAPFKYVEVEITAFDNDTRVTIDNGSDSLDRAEWEWASIGSSTTTLMTYDVVVDSGASDGDEINAYAVYDIDELPQGQTNIAASVVRVGDNDDDKIPNACDNCPDHYNPDQADADDDGIGDVCDIRCGDGVVNGTDVCDDGDTVDGDGCSLSCEVEYGHICEDNIVIPSDRIPDSLCSAFGIVVGGDCGSCSATPGRRFDADGLAVVLLLFGVVLFRQRR